MCFELFVWVFPCLHQALCSIQQLACFDPRGRFCRRPMCFELSVWVFPCLHRALCSIQQFACFNPRGRFCRGLCASSCLCGFTLACTRPCVRSNNLLASIQEEGFVEAYVPRVVCVGFPLPAPSPVFDPTTCLLRSKRRVL